MPLESTSSSRRAFLGNGAAAIAATALGVSSLAPDTAEAQTGRASYGSLIERLGQRAEWADIDLRLVRRITLGMTAADVTAVKSLGFDRYLEQQLNPDAIDDSACDARINTRYPEFNFSLDVLQANAAVYYATYDLGVRRAIVERAVFSKRQLKERMVEFWTDHFNIVTLPTRLVDYRDVARANALGNFGDLVRASMRSPVMMDYLDNASNSRFGINENYARELMELHTLSVDGGYTQQDVHELARVLTGWTVDSGRHFLYDANRHDFGAKTVMGMNFPARTPAGGTAGMDEAINFAEFLIAHPSTARFIATKLLKWFLRPDPSAAQVNAVAAAYTATGGDIKAMLRVILTPNNLANAPAKLKRPFHFYVSMLRCTECTIEPLTGPPVGENIANALGFLGQSIWGWSTPDGYPDRADFWAGLMENRWDVLSGSFGATDSQGGNQPVISTANFMAVPTVSGVLSAINAKLFGGEMTPDVAAELTAWLQVAPTNATRVRQALYFAVCAPDFQYY